MTLANDVKLLKTSRGSFGPEVAAAAENLMCYLDYVIDLENLIRVRSKRPMLDLPRGYYFDMTVNGYPQLCLPELIESEGHAVRIFANDVAGGLLEEICEALDPERAVQVSSELGLGS
jgi:hypothetical protein